MTDRITVSLDDETVEAIERLREESDTNRSELVRRAIRYYDQNHTVGDRGRSDQRRQLVEAFDRRDHVLLDRDFFQLFLHSSQRDDSFRAEVERIASYHAAEYAERFDSATTVLDWLTVCGFLDYRRTTATTVQLLFRDEAERDVMGTFTVSVLEALGYDVTVVETGITKLAVECSAFE